MADQYAQSAKSQATCASIAIPIVGRPIQRPSIEMISQLAPAYCEGERHELLAEMQPWFYCVQCDSHSDATNKKRKAIAQQSQG